MTNQKRTRKFEFGNERFGGSYTPGEFEFNFPEDMTREEFEKMFTSKMQALHKRSNDFAEEIFDYKSRKENLKPLSIRVKQHTKDFFKDQSILSPRDVLEMYEEFNNGSEAFINSLIEEEKELKNELNHIQEKLHNAKLFKEKLCEMEPQNEVLTDEDNMINLQNSYENSEIKSIGNETPSKKAQNDIINEIQTYNTLKVSFINNQYLVITVYNDVQPVVYYFKNEYQNEDICDIINQIEEFCKNNSIDFKKN
ncbi:hypothetical protein [Methanobrevibacter sp.]|uniref:hypothetical protein n=1 Tax=Methanobrevibacter sp. TaxID=66852 RepID=UPI0026DEBD7D|nr:hypothetical protein [Methanobrevibacter sp.]MDO5823239.1 hypothetical protein [Methanobrevibacter sp.]